MLRIAIRILLGDRAKFLLVVPGLIGCATLQAGQYEVLKPGQKAPPITLNQAWNTPDGLDLSWAGLRGQVVVLDFWATWCGPCVQGIPDLNHLAHECRDLPVRFLAVTDEQPDVVRAFLRKHPLGTSVGIDADGTTFKAYGVEARPHCVVVDTQGRIALVMRPQGLTKEQILAVLEGRTERLHDSLARVDVRRHKGVSKSSSLQAVPGGLRLENLPLPALIQFVAPASEGRLDLRMRLPQELLDVEVAAQGTDNDTWRALLRATIEATFGLRLREEPRKQEVLLLTAIPGRTPRLDPPGQDQRSMSSLTHYANTSATLTRFAKDLSARLPLPVVDETGIAGEFSIELTWDPSKPGNLVASVREQLGLDLQPARRELLHLIVEAAPCSPGSPSR